MLSAACGICHVLSTKGESNQESIAHFQPESFFTSLHTAIGQVCVMKTSCMAAWRLQAGWAVSVPVSLCSVVISGG